MVYKKVRVGPWGRASPYKTLLSSPPRGAEQADVNLNFLIGDMNHINQTSVLNVYAAFVMNIMSKLFRYVHTQCKKY